MNTEKGPYYSSGRLKLGKPPSGDAMLVGPLRMREVLGNFNWVLRERSEGTVYKKTAHNEATVDINGFVYVMYRGAQILYRSEYEIILDTAGWNTVSTRRHIQNAVKRLGMDCTLSGQKQIRGIRIRIPEITRDRGVFFQRRGVFRKVGGSWSFESDLGYIQNLGG